MITPTLVSLKTRIRPTLCLAALTACWLQSAPAQAQRPAYMGMGDSIGEGVQSADASFLTQTHSYHVLFAQKLGVQFQLPFIASTPFGAVGETFTRSRFQPSVNGHNLSVSGQAVGSLLRNRADAATTADIQGETDLVLFPRQGSQMEIIEAARPAMSICWIGSNDALTTALSFFQYDASQLTSVASFERDFREIVQRMDAAGIATMYGNIPDVTSIAFLVDRQDLFYFTGRDYGLAEGEYTSVVALFLFLLGLNDGSILDIPDFVLDVDEIATIKQRVQDFNQIIQDTAATVNAPVVDIHAAFNRFVVEPPVIAGVPLTRRFGGGIFSLDGVHPSDIGQALVTQGFIDKANQHWGMSIPRISDAEFQRILLNDAYVDKDGDGQLRGRFGTGILETVLLLLGVTGDWMETPTLVRSRRASSPNWDSALFERIVMPQRGRARAADQQRVIDIFRYIYDPLVQE